MKDGVTNLSASVHARLLNKAKADERPFQEMLQYYAMERFLHRLSRSPHADRFILKGALMLQLWGADFARSTKDIDLLGRGTSDVDALIVVVGDCLETDVTADGLDFDPATVTGKEIRVAAVYAGARLTFTAHLGRARIPLQLDVGFGDSVTPAPREIEYPSLLGPADTRLLGYAPETSLAEKLHAMIQRDLANSRLKDYFDIWHLSRVRAFDGGVLAGAIEATLERRGAPLPTTLPIALTDAYAEAPGKQAQWTGWLRKTRTSQPVPSLAEVVTEVRAFLEPILMSLARGEPAPASWTPGGPWQGTVPPN